MMTNEQLLARNAKRNIGAELLAAVQELQAGQASRTTRFEPLPDDSVRRTVTLADGSVQSQEVLSGAAQSLLKLVSRHPHLLAELT